MAALQPCEVELGINDVGILKLRIRRLLSKLGVSADALGIESTGKSRILWQARDAIRLRGWRLTKKDRRLSAFGLRHSKAELRNGSRRQDIGCAERGLVAEHAQVAV